MEGCSVLLPRCCAVEVGWTLEAALTQLDGLDA